MDVAALRRAITGTLGTLNIGSEPDGQNPAVASLDEVRISGLARVGNSDQVRLLVSEETNRRIKVFDLMGNLLAAWSDSHLLRPRGLALRPDGLVAVADDAATKGGRIEAESLNGTNLLELRVFGNDAAGHAVLVAKLDNLGKGASGAAVQSLGLMLGVKVA